MDQIQARPVPVPTISGINQAFAGKALAEPEGTTTEEA